MHKSGKQQRHQNIKKLIIIINSIMHLFLSFCRDVKTSLILIMHIAKQVRFLF